MSWETIVWIIVIILSVICEAETAALVAIWFMPAAAISLVISFFEVDFWVQVVIFFLLSIAFLLLFKLVINKRIRSKEKGKTDLELLIGKKAVVIEEISNIDAKGAVKLGAQIWSARAEDGNRILTGKVVTVVSIEGVKLICKEDSEN